jgi:hypothetical protein
MAAKRGTDRGRRDPNPEVLQFTLDALVAPGGVLPGQVDDQLLHLLVQRWPARPAVQVGPGADDQAAVPAQQRLRLHKAARPARPGQHAADRGQQRPVGGLQPESWDLAAQDGELVAEHQDLKVFGAIAAGRQPEQLDGAAQREVGEFR